MINEKVNIIFTEIGELYLFLFIDTTVSYIFCTYYSVRDSYICNMMNKEKNSVNPSCKRWLYDDIKEANFMRFLLEVRFTYRDSPIVISVPLLLNFILMFVIYKYSSWS